MKKLKLTRLRVIQYMLRSPSQEIWNIRQKNVFDEYGGTRPEYWYKEIITSGLFERKRIEWEWQEKQKEVIERGTKIHEEFERRLASGESPNDIAEMHITDLGNNQCIEPKIKLVTLPIQHIE
jgi:hypothetical protein